MPLSDRVLLCGLLLQRGGRTTYFGPLGQESSMLVAYLQAVPGKERVFFAFFLCRCFLKNPVHVG
jgi:hypothetical protein